MTEKERFEQAEINERRRFYDFVTAYKPEICIKSFTPINGKDSYDVAVVSGGTEMLIEIKCRDFNHDKFETAILERKKINKVNEVLNKIKQKSNKDIPFYYFSFYNDKLAIFDVFSKVYDVKQILCPHSTLEDNNDKELKWCYFYLIEDAVELINLK